MGLFALTLVLSATGGCLIGQTSQPTGYADAAKAICTLQDAHITEASGIVPSPRNAGCYYVHNDSGDLPQVYLIDRQGRTRLTIRLKHATAVDYEDISLAPGAKAGTFDVCVADIGDNRAQRSSVTIYRFPDVELKADMPAAIDVDATAYRLRYADGPADAEAFCVHPRTGDGYIVTKRIDGHSAVYKLAAPWHAQQETELKKLLTLDLPPGWPLTRIITAADISPDGERLAVRCYVKGWEWRLPPGTGDRDFDRIFKAEPSQLPLAAEPQGEGLCYAPDGRAILTISEGKSPTLHELPALPASATQP
jgi:hypothetical protein